jgi:hypothetical protein
MFDYVMTLASVIIGLALTHLIQGLAGLVEDPKRVRIWWVHLVWVAYMFLITVFWWWFEFMLRDVREWTFAIYIFVLVYALVTYMIVAVLFPRQLAGYHSYEDYFLKRRAWFFGLQILAIALDPIDTALKGRAHLASLGVEYWIGNSLSILLFAIAIWTPRRSVQASVPVLMLLYQITWVARDFATVH